MNSETTVNPAVQEPALPVLAVPVLAAPELAVQELVAPEPALPELAAQEPAVSELAVQEPAAPLLAERCAAAWEHFAEDEGLTGDLLDAEARQLLAWAREEVMRLVNETAALEDAAAEEVLAPRLSRLRKHLRRVARTAAEAEQPQATLSALLAAPDDLQTSAKREAVQ